MLVVAEGDEVTVRSAPRHVNARLAALIFLAYAVMGAWVPVFSLHLKRHGFSPEATAWASAANAIGAVLAPILWGQIADRWLAVERCISLCAVITGVGLWMMADMNEPWPLIPMCIAIWFFLIPVMGLSNACIFRLLEHPERDYGRVRLFGTVGWVAASFCLTLWYWLNGVETIADYSDSLRLAAVIAVLLAMYAWSLPHTPPSPLTDASGSDRSPLMRLIDAPISALRLFRHRAFVVYCICMFGMNVTLPFTIQLNPLLLDKLDVPLPALCLTIAQSTEIVFLFLLPILLTRFGLKPVMVFGGMSWTLGLGLLTVGEPVGLVLSSLLTHGVFICCFLVAGQVFVNRLATHSIRASAQGVLMLISGSGLLLGHLVVGRLRDYSQDNYGIAYFTAAVLAGGMVSVFWIGFAGVASVSKYEDALVEDAEMA